MQGDARGCAQYTWKRQSKITSSSAGGNSGTRRRAERRRQGTPGSKARLCCVSQHRHVAATLHSTSGVLGVRFLEPPSRVMDGHRDFRVLASSLLSQAGSLHSPRKRNRMMHTTQSKVYHIPAHPATATAAPDAARTDSSERPPTPPGDQRRTRTSFCWFLAIFGVYKRFLGGAKRS